MEDRVSLEQLLDLEDDPAFLDLVCPTTGVLAWPAIRQEVFRLLLGDRLYRTAPLFDHARPRNLRQIATGAIRAAAHNRRHPPQRSDVLVVATGAGLMARGGRSFNRYIDYFLDCLKDRAWSLESLAGGEWPSLPRWTQRLGYVADHRLAMAIRARASARAIHRKLARELIDLAARRGQDCLSWDLGDARRSALVRVAARRLAAYPVEAQYVYRLLRQVRPRLILAEEGCYGHMAVFNATARELGVTVAEFQHGVVSRGHDAYNVSPRLAASASYRLTQPASFLSYGEWWNDQFNAPVDDRVVIGNPHRTETLHSWRADAMRTTVVVLGDGVETDAYLALSRRLAAIVPRHLQVLFRPHPLERARVNTGSLSPVPIDQTPDLYGSFSAAHAVIGEASTALFEAIGTVPRIFVWDTDKSRFYLGDHPFERFADPAEIAERLAAQEPGRRQPDTGAIWADNWRGRFMQYIAEHS